MRKYSLLAFMLAAQTAAAAEYKPFGESATVPFGLIVGEGQEQSHFDLQHYHLIVRVPIECGDSIYYQRRDLVSPAEAHALSQLLHFAYDIEQWIMYPPDIYYMSEYGMPVTNRFEQRYSNATWFLVHPYNWQEIKQQEAAMLAVLNPAVHGYMKQIVDRGQLRDQLQYRRAEENLLLRLRRAYELPRYGLHASGKIIPLGLKKPPEFSMQHYWRYQPRYEEMEKLGEALLAQYPMESEIDNSPCD